MLNNEFFFISLAIVVSDFEPWIFKGPALRRGLHLVQRRSTNMLNEAELFILGRTWTFMSRGQHILSVSWLPFHHEDLIWKSGRLDLNQQVSTTQKWCATNYATSWRLFYNVQGLHPSRHTPEGSRDFASRVTCAGYIYIVPHRGGVIDCY